MTYKPRGVDKLRIGVFYALKKAKNANKLFSLRTRYAIDFRFTQLFVLRRVSVRTSTGYEFSVQCFNHVRLCCRATQLPDWYRCFIAN